MPSEYIHAPCKMARQFFALSLAVSTDNNSLGTALGAAPAPKPHPRNSSSPELITATTHPAYGFSEMAPAAAPRELMLIHRNARLVLRDELRVVVAPHAVPCYGASLRL